MVELKEPDINGFLYILTITTDKGIKAAEASKTKLRGIFDMRQGWLKELHDRKRFIAVKVATEDNLADNLTKPLDGKTRKRLDGQLEAIKQRVLRSFRGQVSS